MILRLESFCLSLIIGIGKYLIEEPVHCYSVAMELDDVKWLHDGRNPEESMYALRKLLIAAETVLQGSTVRRLDKSKYTLNVTAEALEFLVSYDTRSIHLEHGLMRPSDPQHWKPAKGYALHLE